MTWIILLVSIAGIGLYLLAPFLKRDQDGSRDGLDEARHQRALVDADEAEGRLNAESAREARDALDRRILDLINQSEAAPPSTGIAPAAKVIVPAVLLLGCVGVYAQIGSPNYQPIGFEEYQAQAIAALPDRLEDLVVELKTRLEADPNAPVDGYVLLARSYLRLGDGDAALDAYQRAIELSGGAPGLIEERDRVAKVVKSGAAAPQIDPDARARIEAMSPDEQAAMISNMVEGLAVRLEQDPNDLQGWTRLIRSRAVLGDFAQARHDLALAHQTFAPETEEGRFLSDLAAQVLPPE